MNPDCLNRLDNSSVDSEMPDSPFGSFGPFAAVAAAAAEFEIAAAAVAQPDCPNKDGAGASFGFDCYSGQT